MLNRKHRFHGHNGVRRVYRYGKPSRTGLMSIHVLSGEKVHTSRLAVVVSRKVHKSAVKRNRIRRRIYSYLRAQLDAMKHPSELVITVYQPEIAVMTATDLEAALNELTKKARL